jgi:hypothetical protein
MKPILLIVILALAGCATPKYNYHPSAGEDHKVMHVKSLATYQQMLGSYTIDEGYYRLMGESKKYEFYLPSKGENSGELIHSGMLDPISSLARRKSDGEVFIVTKFNVRIEVENTHYELTTQKLN